MKSYSQYALMLPVDLWEQFFLKQVNIAEMNPYTMLVDENQEEAAQDDIAVTEKSVVEVAYI